jgi:hypothetical protein
MHALLGLVCLGVRTWVAVLGSDWGWILGVRDGRGRGRGG